MMKSKLPTQAALACLPLLALAAGCPRGSGGVPQPGDPGYKEAVAAFFSAAIAAQVNDGNHRGPFAEKATTLAPGEPAAWANRALGELRSGSMDAEADVSLKKAEELAPGNSHIAVLRGLLQERQGKFDDAVKTFEAAAKSDPANAEALFRIASAANAAKGPDEWKVKKAAYEALLKLQPGNLAALMFLMESLLGAGDRAAFDARLPELTRRAAVWPRLGETDPKATLSTFARTLPTLSGAAPLIGFRQIINLTKQVPDFQSGLRDMGDAIYLQGGPDGTPFTRPLKLVVPSSAPAPPDAALSYSIAPLPQAQGNLAMAFPLDEKTPPTLLASSGAGGLVQIDAKTDAVRQLAAPIQPTALAAFDLDDEVGALKTASDAERRFRLDLAAVGAKGLRLLKSGPGGFQDVTTAAKLPSAVVSGSYTGVWPVDIEADGDLDLVLSPASGEPQVLQNNGDGTFTLLPGKFKGVSCPLKGFAWADFDGDGDPDAALINQSGKIHVFRNERSGIFEPWAGDFSGKAAALAVAETDGDAALDLLVLASDGGVSAHAVKDGAWKPPIPLAKSAVANPGGLFVADLDNNGGLDLIVAGASGSELLLMGAAGRYPAPGMAVAMSVRSVADLNADGALDLIGIADGRPARAISRPTKKYRWQTFTLKAVFPNGEPGNKINAFAVGGELEARTGLWYQKRPLTGPQVHVGLGENAQIDAARVIWPNGNPQGEFSETLGGGVIVADQRLGGSCPFLFAWDGAKMAFVTDCIWRSPLGLKINAQVTAGTTQTEDWVKIRGDQLRPKNGFYDLSVTAELRETHYFDHLSLMAVDHPQNTEIWVDERFTPAQKPLLKTFVTAPPQVIQATGFDGKDAGAALAERDGVYLDDFGRGRYQGVTRDHWVTLTLPESAPRGVPLYLIASGWLHPTDSSLNVAIGQNKSQPSPQGLSIWTPDARGNWTEAKPGLGFPEGKLKTVVLRIDDAFRPGAARSLRLRTNLEVFWDQVRWAQGLPDTALKSTRLSAASAELRFRGFSQTVAKDRSSPELPTSYEELAGTAPRWRDLTGFCTRPGDVNPLLARVDDRYVIMNAGDEMKLRFPELAPPPAGSRRDFVMIADGWEKDGNVNTEWGQTVHPLPAHARTNYPKPRKLEDDPVYKAHASDWAEYHTRYISADRFAKALLP